MTRGSIWTAAARGSYASKPRPVAIIQDGRFDSLDSATVVPFTGDLLELPLFRVRVEPSEANGLRLVSSLMADKVTTLPKARLRDRLGELDADDLRRLERALVVFLGLAG